jgi:hypothetical protein
MDNEERQGGYQKVNVVIHAPIPLCIADVLRTRVTYFSPAGVERSGTPVRCRKLLCVFADKAANLSRFFGATDFSRMKCPPKVFAYSSIKRLSIYAT